MNQLQPDKLNFKKLNGILPVIIQDDRTEAVLMLGFMNEAALHETMARRKVVFWSRSKQRLWEKGEESGNSLAVQAIIPDCDNDTLLIRAIPKGPTCHTGATSCFEAEAIGE